MGGKDICLAILEISSLRSFCFGKENATEQDNLQVFKILLSSKADYLKLPCVLYTYFTYL